MKGCRKPTTGPTIYRVSGHQSDSPPKNMEADLLVNTRTLVPSQTSELADWAPQCCEGWQIAKGLDCPCVVLN